MATIANQRKLAEMYGLLDHVKYRGHLCVLGHLDLVLAKSAQATPLTPANHRQGCSGAVTRWNAVPANYLEPEQRCGKYRWPQVER